MEKDFLETLKEFENRMELRFDNMERALDRVIEKVEKLDYTISERIGKALAMDGLDEEK